MVNYKIIIRGGKSMKSTGIVRKLDSLGRITLPIEARRTMGMKDREPLEMFTEGDMICLKVYNPEVKCAHCEETKNLIEDNGDYICPDCLDRFLQISKKRRIV
jgi:AbrB family transcriptional regulator, transcriptional pleiotropic regulator of transition state genes